MEWIKEILPIIVTIGTIGIFFVAYTGFLFKCFKSEINSMKELFKAEITPIKTALSNHITDTNKKIDELTAKTKELKEDMQKGFTEIKAEIKAEIKELIKK